MAVVAGVDQGRDTAALAAKQSPSVNEQWYILVQVTDHWMIYMREQGRQMFATERAADTTANILRGMKGKNGQPVYKSVLVKAL